MYRKKRVKPRMESQETPASSDTPTKPNTQRLPPPLEYYFLASLQSSMYNGITFVT